MKTLLKDLEEKFESIQALKLLALNYDEALLAYLAHNTKAKEVFFTHITPPPLNNAKKQESSDFQQNLNLQDTKSYDSHIFIFKQSEFLEFLNLRTLDSSYTKFVNKIGLSVDNKLLRADSQVVLNFPYKDCVLKGSQSKDDKAKSKELFFNEILAYDEIDVLLAPKALYHFQCVSADKNHTELKDSLSGKTPNLLIKGNNLIALHCLKVNPHIYGQVKLIYIDPPYNTGNDSFNYNDNFKHSTWLSFMKCRLEVAREFLRDDGVIFVQCDDNEQAYLKVLCDEIFGRENFIACVVWNSINSVLKQSKFIRKEHEYILVYAKCKERLEFNKLENTMSFQNPDNDPKGEWFSSNAASPDQSSNKNKFAIKLPNGKECVRNWKFSYDDFKNNKVSLYFSGGNVPRLKIYKSEYNLYTKIESSIFKDLGSITTATNEIKTLFLESSNNEAEVFYIDFKGEQSAKSTEKTTLFSTPKPEALLKRIIEISTKQNDLVMDFFAGSGTTLAVAHKMNRKWVGVEQMDYIESITKARLEKVIAGEQGGISKAVNFTGGGEFIYCELMPLNAVYKEQIIKAKNEAELESIYKDLQEKAFLDYRVDLKEVLQDRDFKELDLVSKRDFLFQALDSNMDYVLLEDIADSDYGISSEVIELNKAFYGEENE